MIKKLRLFAVAALAVMAAVFAVVGLAACGGIGAKLESLSVENAKINFKIGDEFEYGDEFKVYALYDNGTKEDVTDKANITKEAGFDMNTAGDYQLTVSYGGKKEVYTIYVSDFEPVLKKIELDTSAIKTLYKLGEEISFDGIKITAYYENAQGKLIPNLFTSVKSFKVEVADADGNLLDGDVFTALGRFTVTVSSGPVKASYEATVDGVNISDVQGAIAVGTAFRNEVVSGVQHVKFARPRSAIYLDQNHYEYEFGNNYTHLKETLDSPKKDWHYSINDGEVFCVELQDGEMVGNGALQAAMMYGAPLNLWYYQKTEYGIENALNDIYKHALECTNKDLKETANPENREYSFSFSGLVLRSNSYDYYETSVSFTLGEDYNIAHAEYTQSYWENNMTGPSSVPNFETDENGFTKPVKPAAGNTVSYTNSIKVTVDQTAGERTLTNPYENVFTVTSFDFIYNGQPLGDDGIVETDLADGKITVLMQNVMPETASFKQCPLYVKIDGSFKDFENSSVALLSNDDAAIVFNSNKDLFITPRRGSKFTLLFKSGKVQKKITFDITGEAPESITATIRNDSSGLFINGNSKTLALGGSVHFKGAVPAYKNDKQKAEITSANAAGATVEEVTVNGVKCFKFSSSVAGTYTVKVTSLASDSIFCNFTFTVNETPDYASILSGSYTAQDAMSNYALVFNPDGSADGLKGTVTVTQTPLKDDGTPDAANAKTQTLSYTVDLNENDIKLTHVSGTELGILLEVRADGTFVLLNFLDQACTLTRVSS